MIKETFQFTQDEISIHLSKTKIASIRTRDIIRGAVRIYEQDKIGIAGCFGVFDESALTKKAIENLKLEIPYPCLPAAEKKENRESLEITLDAFEFVQEVEELLESIRKEFPDFTFNDNIRYVYETYHLKNDLALDLYQGDRFINLDISFKHKNSQNPSDGKLTYSSKNFDKKEILFALHQICEGLSQEPAPVNGRVPVIFFSKNPEYLEKLNEILYGIAYGAETSLISGKIGKKIFSNDFTLFQTRNVEDQFYRPFFDHEGTTNPADRYTLVENGILKTPYTDKKTAKQFSLPLTGAASGEFDGLPILEYADFSFGNSGKSFKELLKGQKAVLILMPTGGDYTVDGNFSLHLQTGLLFDGERYTNPVYNITLSSSLNQMFGKDWVGVAREPLFRIPGFWGVMLIMKAQSEKKKN